MSLLITLPTRILLPRSLLPSSSFPRNRRHDLFSPHQPFRTSSPPPMAGSPPDRPRVYVRCAGEPTHPVLGSPQTTVVEDLGPEGEVFRSTLRLVECAMLASVSGLIYILSNSLAIENYFACFFSLPIVLSSMRWGLAAGRKTMVATSILLLTLAGPVKAVTYLLMHGLVGLAMGSLWRLRVGWGLSIFVCAVVRAVGAVGYVLLSSFLIRENILNLITINIHAALMGVLAAIGVNTMLSMNTIYTIFSVLLVLNCGCFVFLVHLLYAVFFSKFGMKDSLCVPEWMQRAL